MFFFFFQAEDGIRDADVTGVETCALPISLPYGGDSLRFYIEAYGLPRGTRLAARALDQDGREPWHDTVAVAGAFAGLLLVIGPGELSVCAGRFQVVPVGAAPAAARGAPFLVSLSDQ